MDHCPAPADGLTALLGSIDIGDIDLDPALQLDATGDDFVEWLESFQDDVPLPADGNFAEQRQAGSTESSHVPSLSSQAGSGSVGDEKVAPRPGRSGVTAAEKVDRLEKVREKNRCFHRLVFHVPVYCACAICRLSSCTAVLRPYWTSQRQKAALDAPQIYKRLERCIQIALSPHILCTYIRVHCCTQLTGTHCCSSPVWHCHPTFAENHSNLKKLSLS